MNVETPDITTAKGIERIIGLNKTRKTDLNKLLYPIRGRRGDDVIDDQERVTLFVDPESKRKKPPGLINWIDGDLIDWSIPVSMMENDPVLEQLIKSEIPLSALEDFNALFVRYLTKRKRHDFIFAAATCTRIENRTTGTITPFYLNPPQIAFVKNMERQRLNKEAIRQVWLKIRQCGATTLGHVYTLWLIIEHAFRHSLIVGHQKNLPAKIVQLYETKLQQWPVWAGGPFSMSAFKNEPNTKVITETGTTITIASNRNPESPSGITPPIIHATEVGKWSATAHHNIVDTLTNLNSMLPDHAQTMFLIESTAKKAENDVFEKMCLEAMKTNQFAFAGFISDPQYQTPIDDPVQFVQSMRNRNEYIDPDYELFLWEQGATLEQINWYRQKVNDPKTRSHYKVKQEYPVTPDEAFQSGNDPVFNPRHIHQMRQSVVSPVQHGYLKGAGIRPPKMFDSIQFIPGLDPENDELHIYVEPDGGVKLLPHQKIINRFVAGMDIGGGMRDKSAFNAIKVLDLAPMLVGKKPRTAARWRKRCSIYQAIYEGIQLCKFYHNAHLIFEHNTPAGYRTDVDLVPEVQHESTGIALFEKYYFDKCYYDADSKRLGFNTNVNTRPVLIDSFFEALAHNLYDELDDLTLDEASHFIEDDKGRQRPATGKFSDVLFATMLAQWYALTCRYRPIVKVVNRTNRNNQVPGINVGEHVWA